MCLYGAPGTGKTYHTVDYALAIINHKKVEDIEKEDRNSLMKEYHSKEVIINPKNWKITSGYIAFTTFHQSYTYEDFIEGLKPSINDDNSNQLKFE